METLRQDGTVVAIGQVRLQSLDAPPPAEFTGHKYERRPVVGRFWRSVVLHLLEDVENHAEQPDHERGQ